MDSLDAETEELEKTGITDTLNALADLAVAGVRPKQKGLTPDLKLDRSVIQSQQAVVQMQSDLLERGFLLQPGETQDTLSLISREGELFAGTEDGLSYRMYFGRVFTGTEEELEVGFSSDDAGDAKATEEESENDEDGEASTSEDTEPSGKPGRYLFVRVEFDPTLLGDEIASPIEPQKPARLTELEEAEANKDASEEKEEEGTDEAESEAEDADGTEEEKEESELERLQHEFSEAQSTYREDKRKFEEYTEKITEGKEKAEKLNRRFAEWYYVIPGESFDKLKLKRADLVKAKEPESVDESSEGEAADSPATPPFPLDSPGGDNDAKV